MREETLVVNGVPDANSPAESTVWAHPFGEVLKLGMNHRHIGFHSQGDVQQVQDKQINKNVHKIRGKIAATNYLRIPKMVCKGTQGLALSGRYLYIQLRKVQDLSLIIHLDVVTSKKSTVRFTLSTIYENYRSTGTVLRVPLRLSDKWSVLVLDMVRLLEHHTFNGYNRERYRHLKAVTFCSNMNLRNVFTTNKLYEYASLPQRFHFQEAFKEQHENYKELYDWTMIPPLNERIESEDLPLYFSEAYEPSKYEESPLYSEVSSTKKISPKAFRTKFVHRSSPMIHTRESSALVNDNQVLEEGLDNLKISEILAPEDTCAVEPKKMAENSEKHEEEDEQIPNSKEKQRTVIVNVDAPIFRPREWPDPILKLRRIIGFSNDFPNALLWVPNGSACIFASFSTIVMIEFKKPLDEESANEDLATRTSETFLHGHTSPVSGLAISNDSFLLASVQNNPTLVRIWDLTKNECLTVIKAQSKGVTSMAFSPDGKRFCSVGNDDQKRTQIMVWDFKEVHNGHVNFMAKQTCDFPVNKILFSPYEQEFLVSCGRENIRFWRIKNQHLPGSPVILNEHARGTNFTDLGFDKLYGAFPSNMPRMRPIYVSSSVGTLLVIDYDSREVACVYKLHDAAINCLSINEGFCVTGSEDRFLRVWPLDFSDFFLEAQHEAGVIDLDVSSDGMKVLAGTRNGAVGVLDISNQRYDTILRTHTKNIVASTTVAMNSLVQVTSDGTIGGSNGLTNSAQKSSSANWGDFVTASADGTMRVWERETGLQTYEFDVHKDQVTCMACHPRRGALAVGFQSGVTRIFDIGTASVKDEFQQHRSALRDIKFSPTDGKVLYTTGADQQVCLFDTLNNYSPLKMVLVEYDASNDGKMTLSNDNKYVALIGKDRHTIVLLHAISLEPALTLTPSIQAELGYKPSILVLTKIAFTAEQKNPHLMILSKANRLLVYSTRTREYTHAMSFVGQFSITSMSLSTNLKYIATGGVDGTLTVWKYDPNSMQMDSRSGVGCRVNQCFVGQYGDLNMVSFSEDDKYVFACGETTTIFVWEFLGDSTGGHVVETKRCPGSVTSENGPMSPISPLLIEVDDQANAMLPSPLRQIPASKSSFELSLDMDRHFIHYGAMSSPKTFDYEEVAEIEDIFETVQLKRVTKEDQEMEPSLGGSSCLEIQAMIGVHNPSLFAWAASAGCFISTAINGRLVIEEIATGKQHFITSMMKDPDAVLPEMTNSTEIVMLKLSFYSNKILFLTSALDAFHVHALDSNEKFQVSLPVTEDEILGVDAVEFDYKEELLISSCRCINNKKTILTVTHIESDEMIWMKQDIALTINRIFALPELPLHGFLSFSREKRQLSFWQSNSKLPALEFIDNFPKTCDIAHARVRRQAGSNGCLLLLDSNGALYFYDLKTRTNVAVTRMTLPQGQRTMDLDFIEWVGSIDGQCIVTGSKHSGTLYVHRLPMKSSRSIVSVDWNLLARGPLISTKLIVSNSSLLRSVSTDPLRELAVVTTADTSVFMVNFKNGSRRLLKKPHSHAFKQVSKIMNGEILLSIAENDSALHLYSPEFSREIATLDVNNASICECFHVNPFVKDGSFGCIAGYSDGTIRVFDLGQLQMTLQCNVASTKPTGILKRTEIRGTNDAVSNAINKVRFLSDKWALALVSQTQVILLDFRHYTCNTTSFASPAPEKEVSYRPLLIEESDMKSVISLDVKGINSFSSNKIVANNHASTFLLLLHVTKKEKKINEFMTKVYRKRDSGTFEEEFLVTDSWMLDGILQKSIAHAMFAPTVENHVIYSCITTQDGPCFQVRDFIQGCVVRRLVLDDIPLSIRRAAEDDGEDTRILAVDSSGRLEAMDMEECTITTIMEDIIASGTKQFKIQMASNRIVLVSSAHTLIVGSI